MIAAAVVVLVNRRPAHSPAPRLLTGGTDAGYVDSFACSGCHRAIWDKFQRSGMGRSMHRAVASVMPSGFSLKQTFYHKASDRHYTLFERDARFFQRRHQIGPSGREINVFEREIHFVVGSGNHAKTFLHRAADGRLYELPLAWYAEGGGTWGMNPGYDHPNHQDFRREVPHECISCHTAYPELAPGADRTGSEPLFPGKIPEGIDCQRCHGPGRDHIQAVNGGNKDQIRKAIMNPSRLTPALQLDVCMQCHLETTSSRLPHAILRWDRGAFSFRPGEPLGNYAIHFDHAVGTGRDDKFEIASHAYRLRKSLCFERSKGSLTCTTCHDPHQPAERTRAVQACRNCHLPALESRAGHPRDPDCIGCHMPKRRTEDVVHVAMTDHYIQRRKPVDDLLATRRERPDTEESAYQGPVELYYPRELPPDRASELYLAVAQVKQFSNLKAGVPRLAKLIEQHRPAEPFIYLELAEAYEKLGQTSEAIRYFEEALQRTPDLRPALLGLAQALAKAGRLDRAAELLSGRPNDSAAWNALGLVRLQQRKPDEAISAFRRGIELQPEFPEAHNNLGGALAETGDRTGAVAHFREAIRLQPDLAGAQRNLAKLLETFTEAEYHFKQAIYYRPNYAPAHFDYGLALAAEERYADAAVEFDAATRADPKMAEAHSSLGDMLALQGNPSQAIAHYRQALALRPDLESARTGLQLAGAKPH
jgi:tetratricopeptide (TPR) repeat protein